MSVFIMVMAILTAQGGQVGGHAYKTMDECRADIPRVTAALISAGVTDGGMTCTEVKIGKLS